MTPRRRGAVGLGSAVAAAGLAAGAALWTFMRAMDVAVPVAAPGAASPWPSLTLARTDLAQADLARGDLAAPAPARVMDDPFFPGRTPPATPYQLAAPVAVKAPVSSAPEGPAVLVSGPVVLGTVVDTRGASFAISTVNGGPPKTVRVGSLLGGYRVDSIERGQVVFLDPDGRRVAVRAGVGKGGAPTQAAAGPTRGVRDIASPTPLRRQAGSSDNPPAVGAAAGEGPP